MDTSFASSAEDEAVALVVMFKNLNCNAKKVFLQNMCEILSPTEALQVESSLRQRCWILMLPEDVWYLIMKFLSVSDAVMFGATCKDFRHISCSHFNWRQVCRAISSAPIGSWEVYSKFRSVLQKYKHELQNSLNDSLKVLEAGPLLGSNIHPKLYEDKLFMWALDSQKVRSGEKQLFSENSHTVAERPVPIQLHSLKSLVLLTQVPLTTSTPSNYWLHQAGSDLFCYLVDGTRGISIIPSSRTGHVGYITAVAFCDDLKYLVTTCSCAVMSVCDMNHRFSQLVFENHYQRPFANKVVQSKFLRLPRFHGKKSSLYVSVAAAHTIIITATVVSKQSNNFSLSDTGYLELTGITAERRMISVISVTCGSSEVFVLLQKGEQLFVWAASITVSLPVVSECESPRKPVVTHLSYVKLQYPSLQLHVLAAGRKLLLVSEGIKSIALYIVENGERLSTVLELKHLKAAESSAGSGISSVHLKCLLCHPIPTALLDGRSSSREFSGYHLRCQWYEAGLLKEAFISCSEVINVDWQQLQNV